MAQSSPILLLAGIAVLIGLLRGGSLRPFGSLKVHWWGLVFVGLMLQVLPAPRVDGVSHAVIGATMLIASNLLLLTFLAVNRWIPAARVMALGIVLNLAVITLNGGMPVSAWAIQRASGTESVPISGIGPSAKHHLMTPDDLLRPLGDVIPIPSPIAVVISIGDVFLYAGVAWFIVQVMLGRSHENPRPLAMWFLTYRGKHAPNHWRMPARYRTSDHVGAGQSGT